MIKSVFDGDFTQQEMLPDKSIRMANDVLAGAKLHRYNVAKGEESQTALLEKEYAAYQGRKYCLALSSCGQALQIALRALEVEPRDTVLTNAFTLAPVPGSIAAVGAKMLLIETTTDLKLSINDLEQKAALHPNSVLLLSHMRGHISDMEKVMAIVGRYELKLIEDCAHTMGASWNGIPSGNFGEIGCFSTQTYKHMNSGEGGFLTTDDPTIIAKAIFLSGSYMLFAHHGTIPESAYFDAVQPYMPNLSARMDNLRAALLRPQLENLSKNIGAWNERYDVIHLALSELGEIYLPKRDKHELYVGSSIQFLLVGANAKQCQQLVEATKVRGVALKWFGADAPAAFTSTYKNWKYADEQHLQNTDAILSQLFDMRIPLSFTLDDCALIAEIIVDEVKGLNL